MQKLELGLILILAFCLLASSITHIHPVSSQGSGANGEEQTAIFRPFYPGYAYGTTSIALNVNTSAIDREWNLVEWNITQTWDPDKGIWVSSFAMYIVFCEPDWVFWPANGGIYYSPPLKVYISTDRGETYSINRTFGRQILEMNKKWGEYNASSDWLYVEGRYYFEYADLTYFTPDTRIKFQFIQIYPFEPGIYIGNHYWGQDQLPVPPSDFNDTWSSPPNWSYVQYATWFSVEYIENHINYTGANMTFPYAKTEDRLKLAADMILNCFHPSGCVHEVVTTDIPFGRDSWVILYSSELAIMNLIDLCSIFPDEASHYLVSAKRFMAYLFSKQNMTDGSFPFILTDGDQHCWYNATANLYYGYDKIDSFSACAISLVRKYYDATGNLTFVTDNWDHIKLSQDFIYDLTNQTVWLPVDGYHYNGTHYNKSEWNWLHDVCEAYQGLKDLAYLYNQTGDSGNYTYWDNFAESIATATRSRMWNETQQRYVGMYNVMTQEQNDILVYNVITPVIYGIETNETRASLTISKYLEWGLLSGRYYNTSWADDYSVYNEYSTMSGMLYSAFYNLIADYNYTEPWMKDSFLEISKFLFLNPIYPDQDLQNADGFLDYVNLVNYTWAPEYARLVEGSGWFIEGFLKMPNMTSLFTYTDLELLALNQSLQAQSIYWNDYYTDFQTEYGAAWNSSKQAFTQWQIWIKNQTLYVQWYDFQFLSYIFEEGYIQDDEPWWEPWTPDDDWIWHYVPISFLDAYFMLGVGITGIVMLIAGPTWFARTFIKHGLDTETVEHLGYAMLFIIMGFGFLVVWLWPG